MSYKDRLQRYGSASQDGEIRLYAYITDPKALTADRIKHKDDIVSRFKDGKVEHLGKYSQTTTRHQKEFERQLLKL